MIFGWILLLFLHHVVGHKFVIPTQFVDLRVKIVTDNLQEATLAAPLFKIWAQSRTFMSAGIFINITFSELTVDTDPIYYRDVYKVCAGYKDNTHPSVNLVIIYKPFLEVSKSLAGAAVATSNCIWISPNLKLAGSVFAHELGHLFYANSEHTDQFFEPNGECSLNYGELMQYVASYDFTPDDTRLVPCGKVPTIPEKYLTTPNNRKEFSFDRNFFCQNFSPLFYSYQANYAVKDNCETTRSDASNCEFCYFGKIYTFDQIMNPPELNCRNDLELEKTIEKAFRVQVFSRYCEPVPFFLSPDNIDRYAQFKKLDYYKTSEKFVYQKPFTSPSSNHSNCDVKGCVIKCYVNDGRRRFASTVLPTGDACDDDTGVCLEGNCVPAIEGGFEYSFYDGIQIKQLSVAAIRKVEFEPANARLESILIEVSKFKLPYFSRITRRPKGRWQMRLASVRLLKLIESTFNEQFVINNVAIQKFHEPLQFEFSENNCSVLRQPFLPCSAVDWDFQDYFE